MLFSCGYLLFLSLLYGDQKAGRFLVMRVAAICINRGRV